MRKSSVRHANVDYGTASLMRAIGAVDFAFYDGLLEATRQLQPKRKDRRKAASNFMLAVIKGIEPRDQVEAMLAAQMAAVHNATMTFARRLASVDNIPQQDSAQNALNKLDPHVHGPGRGAQAIPKRRRAKDDGPARPCRRGRAGDRRQRDRAGRRGGGTQKSRRINPRLLDMRRALRCRGRSKQSRLQCRAPAVSAYAVCRMHGAAGRGSQGQQERL